MKVVWNIREKEFGRIESTNENYTTKSLFENFKKQLPLEKTYVTYLEKILILLQYQCAMKSIKLVTDIRLITVFDKNGLGRNIWFQRICLTKSKCRPVNFC